MPVLRQPDPPLVRTPKAPVGAMRGRFGGAQVDIGISQLMTLAGGDVTRA